MTLLDIPIALFYHTTYPYLSSSTMYYLPY